MISKLINQKYIPNVAGSIEAKTKRPPQGF